MSTKNEEKLPMNAEIEPILSVRDLIPILGRKKSWIYARTRTGEIPSIRLPGGGYAYRPERIREWIESLERKPATLFALRGE